MPAAPATLPLISIVVPFFNVERYIASCIEGLKCQSYPADRFEIILVDNHSTDRSAEIASGFEGITLLYQPVIGSYAARNMGIREARGDIIATLDPDCRPDTDWLCQIAETMQDANCHIVLGHVRHANNSTMLDLLEKYETEKVAYITDKREAKLYFGYTNNMAFRRTVFDEIGLFPERVRGGDTIFVRRAVDKLGCEIVCFNPRMHATHLEVDTLKAYYSKRHTYGDSNERIARTLEFRPLKNAERWLVFKRLVRNQHFSLRKTLLLLALLAPGALIYESGRRKRMLRSGE